MANIQDSVFVIRTLDDLSYKETAIARIHPIAKCFITMMFIVMVVSFDKYEINGLLPYMIYPVVLIALGDIPVKVLMKRILLGMIFVVGIGIFNPLLDQGIRYEILGVTISGGWVSFASLMLKSGLTISAALLLLATTGMNQIILTLNTLKVPQVFILQFTLTFRYIDLLIDEISKTYQAYSLRAPEQKGIHFRAWGSLCGQIIMRTFTRAESIYEAMMLRGFKGKYHVGQMKRPALKDLLYSIVWVMTFIVFRFINIPAWIGAVTTGGVR